MGGKHSPTFLVASPVLTRDGHGWGWLISWANPPPVVASLLGVAG